MHVHIFSPSHRVLIDPFLGHKCGVSKGMDLWNETSEHSRNLLPFPH